MSYWRTKTFKTREEMEQWVSKNYLKYQMSEVFINNAYGIDYRPLIKL